MRVEPGPQVGFEAAGVVMGGAVVVARVVGVWTGVGLGRVDAETAAAAARRKAKILAVAVNLANLYSRLKGFLPWKLCGPPRGSGRGGRLGSCQ
jgi:hypothetical protein